MADYTRKYKRGRWAGSTDSVLEAVHTAQKTLKDWSDADEEPHIDIGAQVGGQKIGSQDVGELESIITRELGSVKQLSIRVQGTGNVKLAFSSDAGLEFQVSGKDPDAVRGLWAHLRDIFEAGQYLPRWYSREGLGMSGLISLLPLSFGVGMALSTSQSESESDTGLLITGITIGLVAVVGMFLWLTPNLEMLRPNEYSRIRRFRAAAIAAVVALVIGIVGSVMASGIT